MTTEQQETPPGESVDPLRPNVKTFKPAAFELYQFEVVAEGSSSADFSISEFVCLEKAPQVSDPMFEVFDDSLATPEQIVAEEMEQEQAAEPTDEDVDFGAQESETAPEEPSGEGATFAELSQEVQDLRADLLRLEEEKKALEEDHARQLEELRAQVTEEVRQEAEKVADGRVKATEDRYATLIEDMNTQIQEGIEGVERRAVEFAVQVAKKLVGTTVEVNPEYILGIIKEATKLTGGATIKAIRVSPQDHEFLKMLSPDRQFKEFDGSWSFQADETIHAGCVVETSSGQVEFDLDKAWERIKESVIKVR